MTAITVPLAAVLLTFLPTGVVPLSHLLPCAGLDSVVTVLRDLVAPMEVGAVVVARDIRPMMEMTVHGLQS
jgi:hypothetical protein